MTRSYPSTIDAATAREVLVGIGAVERVKFLIKGADKIGGSGGSIGISPHLSFCRKFAQTPHKLSPGNTALVRVSVEGKKVGTIQLDKIMQLSQQSFRGQQPTRSPRLRLAERTGGLAERDVGRIAVDRKAVDWIERNPDPRTVRRVAGYNLDCVRKSCIARPR